ncbi:MAG: hypothetical protein AMXMBFR84_30770 [Candidatus Hydrogenedentota bacterium]
MNNPHVPKVVLLPDVFIHGVFARTEKDVLTFWRDGRYRVIVSRPLLSCYLRLLRDLGLEDPLLRSWLRWFTAPEKAQFVSTGPLSGTGWWDMAMDASRAGNADFIVVGTPIWSAPDAIPQRANWVSVTEFLECVAVSPAREAFPV